MFEIILFILFSTVIKSCTISIIWDSTYYTNEIPNGFIYPPNSEFCHFHLGWRIVLNVKTVGRFENLWQVEKLEEFENCDPINAIDSRFFTGVHEFSLSPGLFSFDSIYYFFSTSNGTLANAEDKQILSNCNLKLAFKLKQQSSNCTLNHECFMNKLSLQTTTIATTTNGNSTLTQSYSSNNTIIPKTDLLLTDLQILIFVLIGFIIVIVFGICLILMLYFAVSHDKRRTEEVSNELDVDPDFETYFKRFLTLEKVFKPEREFQSVPNLHSNYIQNVELCSLPNMLLRDSVYSFGLCNSSEISENSIYKTKSITLV